MIAVAIFPPAPTAVGMLEIVESIKTLSGDLIEFTKVVLALGMCRIGARWFDSAEDPGHRSFGLES